MTLENVEDPFKNRLSFSFHMMGDWAMNGDFWVKKHISSVNKTFSPSSLNYTRFNGRSQSFDLLHVELVRRTF